MDNYLYLRGTGHWQKEWSIEAIKFRDDRRLSRGCIAGAFCWDTLMKIHAPNGLWVTYTGSWSLAVHPPQRPDSTNRGNLANLDLKLVWFSSQPFRTVQAESKTTTGKNFRSITNMFRISRMRGVFQLPLERIQIHRELSYLSDVSVPNVRWPEMLIWRNITLTNHQAPLYMWVCSESGSRRGIVQNLRII
jgi:hypothetical protein